MIVTRKKNEDGIGSNLWEEVRDILTALEANKDFGNPEEEDVAVIEEIAEVVERRQKD